MRAYTEILTPGISQNPPKGQLLHDVIKTLNKDEAKRTAEIFTIVQTARSNGLKVEQYLKYIIENIKKKDIEELLPWSDNLPEYLKITTKDI